MPIDIRKARTQSDLDAVFRLRYAVYIEELGRMQRYADHDARTICEPLDRTGHLFCAYDNSRLVGTLRTNYSRDADLSDYAQLYDMAAVDKDQPHATSVTSKLLVTREYRSSMLGYGLAAACYRANLLAGMEYDFIDVYPARVPFFQRLGYQIHRPEVVHPEFGSVIVMRLKMRDEAHLRMVKSPFLRYLRRAIEWAA
jgi:hypothetical protein